MLAGAMTRSPTPSPSPWRRRLLLTATLAAAAALVWSQLPKAGYPTDLAVVGQGRPALVLAMEGNYQEGASVMNLLHGLRGEFEGSVHFVVAALGRPEGRAFAERHQARDGTVLLFDAGGQRVAVLQTPQAQDELRQALRRLGAGSAQ